MRIYTKKGDDGTTGLLFGGDRVSKADLRTDAYGTTDEAVSALGLARASIGAATGICGKRLDRSQDVKLFRHMLLQGCVGAHRADRHVAALPLSLFSLPPPINQEVFP